MSVFRLKIIASDKVFFDGEVNTIIVPAPDGEQQIMAHHESMVIAVAEGGFRFRITEDGEWVQGICGIGFVDIGKEKVTMVVDTAERPEDIDRMRAQRALERAREQLQQKQSIEEYHVSAASLARAMARLKGAGGLEEGIDI